MAIAVVRLNHFNQMTDYSACRRYPVKQVEYLPLLVRAACLKEASLVPDSHMGAGSYTSLPKFVEVITLTGIGAVGQVALKAYTESD